MTTVAEDIDRNAEQLGAHRVEVLNRLTRETGALFALRHAITPSQLKSVVLGAAVGGTVVALALVIDHRRRERNRPLRRLEHAWTQLARSRRPSLLFPLVKSGLGALARTVATEAAETILRHVRERLDQTRQDHAPSVDPPPATPHVASPAASTIVHPSARLLSAIVQPPEPILPTAVPPMHDRI